MKILHIISSMNPVSGGPTEGIRRLSQAYLTLGITCTILTSDDPSDDYLKFSKENIIAVGPSFTKYSLCFRMYFWLRKNIYNYDVVIINGIWQFHSVCTLIALLGTQVPYYIFTHGMLDPWFKRSYRFKHLKKLLYWILIEYWVLKNSKAVLFTCEEERILARESFSLHSYKELVVGYGTSPPPSNGLELSNKFLESHPELKRKRLILFLSRIHEKKGCDILIKAFSQILIKDSRLHLVMAGPSSENLRAELLKLSANLGVANHISWVGMLQNDEKWGAFYSSEVFALPSHQENFGIVVAESLACGRPVLISYAVNIWREIDTFKAGFVDTDTLDGVVSSLEKWLALTVEEKRVMSESATKCFAKYFRIEKVADNLKHEFSQHLKV